ncbi:ATP synthase F0 subunit C [Myxococcota bacterium]|jgi:F-type H+-transporting ATPase subunit c|nr:ATP synthase F0 subunit C [Myxococcota bacterium]
MKSKLSTVLPVLVALLMVSTPAFAQDGGADMWKGYVGIGAGLAIGVAALGGALAQGRAAAAALEGIARNPQASGKLFTPMIIGLALIESLVIYALVIGFQLQGKI